MTTKVHQKRLNGGERVTWPLTPNARCIDCGQPIVHLHNGRVRIDPTPSLTGTLAVAAGQQQLRAATASVRDTRARFDDHAHTCPRRPVPTDLSAGN